MPFCTHCGTFNSDGVNFCRACGAAIPTSAPSSGYGESGAYRSPSAYEPMESYRVNIRQRDLALCIILSIVTCGIYALVWFFNLVSDLNTAAPEADDKTPGTVFLLTLITCGIYGLIWIYNAGNKVDTIRRMNNELPSNSSLIYLLLSLFGLGIVSYCLIQSELNKVAQVV